MYDRLILNILKKKEEFNLHFLSNTKQLFLKFEKEKKKIQLEKIYKCEFHQKQVFKI